MSGSLWKLQVAEGDAVEDGQVVALVESMKMEVEIVARQDWVSALATGTPWDDDATNEDASFVFDKRYCIKWTDVSAHPWQGSVAQLDHSIDPWQAEMLLEAWLHAALMRGTAPEKRPGKTQPARQPSWDDPWWDAP